MRKGAQNGGNFMQVVATKSGLTRDIAIDATRGIVILLVVLFHVTRGFVSAGWLPDSYALDFADTFTYGFHVQTFLLISGYLAYPRAGQVGFQLQRQAWLYHAYLLWSLISWVLIAAMSNAVNNPLDLRDLLLIPIVPIQHFWFLLCLMLGIALLAVLRTPWALIGGGIALILLANALGGLTSPLGQLDAVCMVLVGAWLRATDLKPRANLPIALLCLAFMGLCTWWKINGAPGFAYPDPTLPFALSGSYAAYTFGTLAGRSGMIGSVLAYLGQHSLVIYLTHVIAGSGLRVILMQVAPGLNLYVALALVIGASVAAPLIFEKIAQWMGLAKLFALRPIIGDRARPAAVEAAPVVLAPSGAPSDR